MIYMSKKSKSKDSQPDDHGHGTDTYHPEGADSQQVNRPDSDANLSHKVMEGGHQSADASDNAATVAMTGHPDQEIQTGMHQPMSPEEARRAVRGQLSAKDRENAALRERYEDGEETHTVSGDGGEDPSETRENRGETRQDERGNA